MKASGISRTSQEREKAAPTAESLGVGGGEPTGGTRAAAARRSPKRGGFGGGGALPRRRRIPPPPSAHRVRLAGAGRLPGEGAFWALNRPTTPLPCRPPERRSTALERPLRQQTTGKRFWR